MIRQPGVVIGVDPGKVSGVSVFRSHDEVFYALELEPMATCEHVEQVLLTFPGVHVHCERFTQLPSRAKTAQNDALELIGALRWLTHRHLASFKLHGAGDAARASSREVLTQLDWWRPSRDGHMNKSTAQLVLGLLESTPQFLHFLLERGRMTS